MNALIELREIMKRNQLNFDNIRCAHISYGVDVFHEDSNYIEYEKSIIDDFKEFILVDTHNNEDLAEFLRFLDFEYNDGYGGQNLFGKIWF